MAHSTL